MLKPYLSTRKHVFTAVVMDETLFYEKLIWVTFDPASKINEWINVWREDQFSDSLIELSSVSFDVRPFLCA
jgi:hypothetical protein